MDTSSNRQNPYIGFTQDKLNELLIDAATKGNFIEIQLLLEAGADANAVHSNGSAAILFAAQGGHTEIVELLVSNGANLTATSRSQGTTALIFAAINGHITTVKTLISLGLNVNAVDNNGASALMITASANHITIAEALINAGANIHLWDCYGWTALAYAEAKNHSEVIQLLKKKDANGADHDKEVRAISASPCYPLVVYADRFKNGFATIEYGEIRNGVKVLERCNLIGAHHLNIIKKTYPESFSEIPPTLDHLQVLFNGVQEIVKQGLEEAKLQNKKLFLAAGEGHHILNSLFFQLSLLQAAQQTKEINHLLAEVSEKGMQQKIPFHPRKNVNMSYSIPYARHSLNMKVIPMNLDFKEVNEETVTLRDNYMGLMALNCDSHAIAFCGYSHLKAFNDNHKLKEKHHVILMDITGFSPEMRKQKIDILQSSGGMLATCSIFPDISPEVIRPQLKGNMELFSHEEIMDWRNMYKNRENHLATIAPVAAPVSIFSSLNQLVVSAFEMPQAISSGCSSLLTQMSSYIPSFFAQSKDAQMKKEEGNKRKRPEDDAEKNKNARKRRRVGSGSSHSHEE